MYRFSHLIASTNVNSFLKDGHNTIVVNFMDTSRVESIIQQLNTFNSINDSKNFSLHFENIQGNDVFPIIDVYLNLEKENVTNEKNFVGGLALYGLIESSNATREHAGNGQHHILDLGSSLKKVRNQSNWSMYKLILTLVPHQPLPVKSHLIIGRIALYYHER